MDENFKIKMFKAENTLHRIDPSAIKFIEEKLKKILKVNDVKQIVVY